MTAAAAQWFDVDRDGLRRLLERRGGPGGGKLAMLHELIANAWDADGATRVEVKLEYAGRGRSRVVVTDDAPNGFTNFMHAWTLFAESRRRDDPGKRGRFNLGEKVALAFCDSATIRTTTGGVKFNGSGRSRPDRLLRTESGSEFVGVASISQRELAEISVELTCLIVPAEMTLVVNGTALPARKAIATFEANLTTEVTDVDGVMRRVRRTSTISVYEPIYGQPGSARGTLYELGVPVVETGDPWDVDVGQKVPLNMERDNVTPAYLRELRALVANHMHPLLDEEGASGPMGSDALTSPLATPEAVRRVLDLRYGERRAVFDPSDPEANMRLVAEGYQMIHGGQLTAAQWDNVRRHEAALPSGRISPTPKARFSADGRDAWLPKEKWTPAIARAVRHVEVIGERLLRHPISVGVLSSVTVGWSACFLTSSQTEPDQVVLNLGRLGHGFFERSFGQDATRDGRDALRQLVLHELAHAESENHLSAEYAEACCRLGARLTRLALEEPGLFLEPS